MASSSFFFLLYFAYKTERQTFQTQTFQKQDSRPKTYLEPDNSFYYKNLARSKTQISLSSARAAVRLGRDGPERSGHSCASLLVETVRSGRVGTVRDGPGTRAQACSWGRSGRFGDGPERSGRSGTDSYL